MWKPSPVGLILQPRVAHLEQVFTAWGLHPWRIEFTRISDQTALRYCSNAYLGHFSVSGIALSACHMDHFFGGVGSYIKESEFIFKSFSDFFQGLRDFFSA